MSVAVSVLLPSYNHEKFIDEAIQSVLDQDFEDWELIVIDDASSDGSWDRIQAYRDPRIRAAKNSANQGVCRTYNRALEMAGGDVIMPLGSDDRFRPNKLRRQVDFLEQHPETGIVSSWLETTPSDPSVNAWFNREINLNDPYHWLGDNNLAHCTTAIRAEAHARLGALDPALKYTHDWDFWLRAIELGIGIEQIPLVLADYRVSDTGLSSADSLTTLLEYFTICQQHWHPYLIDINAGDLVALDITRLMVAYGDLLPKDQQELADPVAALLQSSREVLPAVVGNLSAECQRFQLMAKESTADPAGLSDAKEWLRRQLVAERQRTVELELSNAELEKAVDELQQEVAGLRQRPADRINHKLRQLRSVLRD
jgi:GT2 family glycosyltransferase/uncharacterized coiled-coil protein SlyX